MRYLIPLLLLSLAGCTSQDRLAHLELEDGCWPLADTLTWTQTLEKGATFPAVELELGTEFRTQNLFLKVLCMGPGLDQPREYLIEEELLTKEGEWLAPISGGTVRWNINSRPQLELPQAGDYTFKLFHFMRDSSLCEVHEVRVLSED